MQYKSTVLAAIFLAAGSAHAEPNVTIFGVLDVGVLSETNASNLALGYLPSASNKGSVTELKDGGLGESYWGMRGSEDLGGGLKAQFNLQGNFNAANGIAGGPNSTGTTSLFNQQANVGLSGSFGAVKAGRVVSPIYEALSSTDVRQGAYFGSALTGVVGMNSATGAFSGSSSNATIGALYNDNAIVYTTPTINGFTGNLEVTMAGVAGNNTASRQEAATLTYNANSFKFDAFIYNGNDDGIKASGNPTGNNTNRLISIGALYKISDFSIDAGYFKGSNPANSGSGINPAALGGAVTSGDIDMFSFGLGYRASSQVNITSGVYHIEDKANSGNKSTLFAVGLDYYLSTRTRLYIEGASVNNQGSNMNQAPVYGTPVTAGGSGTVTNGITSTAWMAGIRHTF